MHSESENCQLPSATCYRLSRKHTRKSFVSCHHRRRKTPSPARKRSRQLEPWEHAVFEAGHRRDPVAPAGEDVKTDTVAHAVWGAQVGSECRLTVCSSPNELEPPTRTEDVGAEAGHEVSALVLKWHRRHRNEHVVRQKGHQGIQIGGLPCADELGHDCIL